MLSSVTIAQKPFFKKITLEKSVGKVGLLLFLKTPWDNLDQVETNSYTQQNWMQEDSDISFLELMCLERATSLKVALILIHSSAF